MKNKTNFFKCPGCRSLIGVVGTQSGNEWAPPQTINISGHTEGNTGIVPCSVAGEHEITPKGIGKKIEQPAKVTQS